MLAYATPVLAESISASGVPGVLCSNGVFVRPRGGGDGKSRDAGWMDFPARTDLVLIGGEAGIGKTALAEALGREAAERGAPVLGGLHYAYEPAA